MRRLDYIKSWEGVRIKHSTGKRSTNGDTQGLWRAHAVKIRAQKSLLTDVKKQPPLSPLQLTSISVGEAAAGKRLNRQIFYGWSPLRVWVGLDKPLLIKEESTPMLHSWER